MKIRNGFVSNSSSSSFCIMGTIVEKYNDNENFRNALEYLKNIDWHYTNSGCEEICVGIDVEKMQEYETLHAFKLRAQKVLSDEGLEIPVEEIHIFYGEYFDG